MSIVEVDRAVTGGVDTHLDIHAVAGSIRGAPFWALRPSQPPPRAIRPCWSGCGGSARLQSRGRRDRSLRGRPGPLPADEDIAIAEVDRPNRQARRRQGKSDFLDAIEAAGAAQSEERRDWPRPEHAVEAIRVLSVAKRSARGGPGPRPSPRCASSATPPLSSSVVLSRASPSPNSSPRPSACAGGAALTGHRVHQGRALESGLPVRDLDAEITALDERIGPLVTATAPELVALFGIGIDTAATLLSPPATTPSGCV